MQNNKIIIAGGSGYLGQALIHYLNPSIGPHGREWTADFYQVVVLTRDRIKTSSADNIRYVYWDGKTAGEWINEFEGAQAVINFSGRTVNCRYNEKNKADIFASRLDSTRAIGEAIQQCQNPPEIWINAGSATIYRHSTDKQMTEANGEFHNDFSVQVCQAWEKTFNEMATPRTRKVLLRIAITLGTEGGVLKTLRKLTRWGLGGRQGNGRQYVSWIHEEDLCRIIVFAMENANAAGIYNAAAPGPVRNAYFMKTLRQKSRVRLGIPQPGWVLNFGTWLMGTEKELVLKSRNVVPERLLKEGFTFRFNTVEEAMEDLIGKTHSAKQKRF